MLVLSRKIGQKVHIGENITLTLLDVRGGHVRLGIDAPNHIRILRGELVTPADASIVLEQECVVPQRR